MDISSLYLVGPVSESGYGKITEEIAKRFLSRGINLKLTATHSPENENLIPTELRNCLVGPEFVAQALALNMPNLFHINPHLFRGHGLFAIKTTHESEVLPKEWIDNINSARALIVQTNWMKSVMLDNKITVPIHVVPEGLDSTDTPNLHRPPQNVFRFFAIEKCINIIVQAFSMAFGDSPDVELVVKTRPPMNHPGEFTTLAKNIIVLPMTFLSEASIKALYYSSHCLVHPVEGAGWSLPICEAIAKGIPVIANRHTAIAEYTQAGDLLEPGFETRPFFFEEWSAFPGRHLGSKHYPTVEGLAASMIAMKNNYAVWKEKTLNTRTRLLLKYNWNITTSNLVESLNKIYSA